MTEPDSGQRVFADHRQCSQPDSGAAVVVGVALAQIKRSVWNSLGYDLEQSLAREIDAQEQCWNTRDSKEGVAAFLGKREAKFEGR